MKKKRLVTQAILSLFMSAMVFLSACSASTSKQHSDVMLEERTTAAVPEGFYTVHKSKSFLLMENNKVARDFSGLKRVVIDELSPEAELYYFSAGVFDTTAQGLVQLDDDIYYIRKGVVDTSFSGDVSQNGFQWKVSKGIVVGGPNGTTKLDGKTYKVRDGKMYLN